MNTAPSFKGNVTPITNKKMWELLSLPPSALGHCWTRGAVLGAPAQHSHSSLLPWCFSIPKPCNVPLCLSTLFCLMFVHLSFHLCMPAGISTISIPIKSLSFSSYFHYPERAGSQKRAIACEWQNPCHGSLCHCSKSRKKYSPRLPSWEILLLICGQMEFNCFKGKTSP